MGVDPPTSLSRPQNRAKIGCDEEIGATNASNMSFSDDVNNQIALLNAGKPLEAFDLYFDDDGMMFDNDLLFAKGKAACRAKQEPFISQATHIVGNITQCSMNVEASTCTLRNQSTFVNASGDRCQIDGLHLQRWAEGKIVEERYYRDELLAQKIEEGILNAPV